MYDTENATNYVIMLFASISCAKFNIPFGGQRFGTEWEQLCCAVNMHLYDHVINNICYEKRNNHSNLLDCC